MAATVLNVDDSADDVTLLKLACSAANVCFRLETVDSGEGAIAYLEGAGDYGDRARFPLPDLILLDLKMPGKSGFDILEWLRSTDELKQIPAVVFTSSMHEKDRLRALELGARQYVVKPVGYQALQHFVQTMDQVLGRNGSFDANSFQGITADVPATGN